LFKLGLLYTIEKVLKCSYWKWISFFIYKFEVGVMAKRMVKSGTKLVVWFFNIKICETKVKWFQLRCELWIFLRIIYRNVVPCSKQMSLLNYEFWKIWNTMCLENINHFNVLPLKSSKYTLGRKVVPLFNLGHVNLGEYKQSSWPNLVPFALTTYIV